MEVRSTMVSFQRMKEDFDDISTQVNNEVEEGERQSRYSLWFYFTQCIFNLTLKPWQEFHFYKVHLICSVHGTSSHWRTLALMANSASVLT